MDERIRDCRIAHRESIIVSVSPFFWCSQLKWYFDNIKKILYEDTMACVN